MSDILDLFSAANDETEGRVDWRTREQMIVGVFPAAGDPPWEDTIADDATLERVLVDLLKHEQLGHDQAAGKSGPPRALDWDRGIQSWRELTGQDYTGLPFGEALRVLARDGDGSPQSLRFVERKTGVSRTRLSRLLAGIDDPDLEVLERVARAYGKKPAFFVEWRAHVISRHLVSMLVTNPEFSALVYRKVIARREGNA